MFLTSNAKATKAGAIRNMVFFLLSWFFIFSAYGALELLQSSLNTENGLGVYSISILYGMKALSSLFGPVIVRTLTPKWTLLVGYICHTLFILCNFYPKWFTMVPASILLGLATGPLWICCGIYTTVLGVYYANATDSPKDGTLSKFNGIHGLVISLSVIAGNTVSSTILKYVTFEDASMPETTLNNAPNNRYSMSDLGIYGNDTLLSSIGNCSRKFAGICHDGNQKLLNDIIASTEQPKTTCFNSNESLFGSMCGTMYCPRDHFENEADPDDPSILPHDKTVMLLLSVLGIFNICGIIFLLLGLQNLPLTDIIAHDENVRQTDGKCHKLIRYVKLLFNCKFILLIPSISYIYIGLAVNNSTFTKAYVTCTVGIEMIGYIAMATGIAMAITTYFSGLLGQCLHRNYLFCFGFVALLGVYGTMLIWDTLSSTTLLFIVAVLFGCANGVNMPHFSAFLGAVFTDRKTEAFSFYQFMSGLVMCVGYFLTNRLCVRSQIYVVLAIMGLAMITYAILAIQLYQSEREAQAEENYIDDDFESNAAREMEIMIRKAMESSPKHQEHKRNYQHQSVLDAVAIGDNQNASNVKRNTNRGGAGSNKWAIKGSRGKSSRNGSEMHRKRASSMPSDPLPHVHYHKPHANVPHHDRNTTHIHDSTPNHHINNNQRNEHARVTIKDIQDSQLNASQHSINQV